MRTRVTFAVEVKHNGVSTPEIIHRALTRLASAYLDSGQNVEQMNEARDISISALDSNDPAPPTGKPLWEQLELFDSTPFQVPKQLVGDSEVEVASTLDITTIKQAIEDLRKGTR